MNIDDYINNRDDSPEPLSFSMIARQFIIDDPERANFFYSDQIANSALNILKQTAVLIERFFPKLDFENYLTLCISNECHSRRVCNVLRNNQPASKHEMFEFLTDIICPVLVTYDKETHWKIRRDYLLQAHVDFTALNFVNVAQSNKAIKYRPNALNDLILIIAGENPKISRDALYKELKKDKHEDVIDEINETTISYYQYDKQIKVVATSGLKDRLTDAKKIINQRIALTG